MHRKNTISMTIEYEDEEIKLLIETGRSNDKRYKKLKSNKTFIDDLVKVFGLLKDAPDTEYLKKIKSLNYEPLQHDLSGMSSVRIGYKAKYRLLFTEFDNGIKIRLIEINEHYGDK